MTFAYFLLLYLFVSLILDMEECVSAILLQLIVLPFSPLVILESPNVYTSIIRIPVLPLSIEYPLFVYLYRVLLPSCDICLVL
jgi:hypothetical protein